MSKGTTVRAVRISDSLWAKAGEQARSEDTNVSTVIRELLTEWLAIKGEK